MNYSVATNQPAEKRVGSKREATRIKPREVAGAPLSIIEIIIKSLLTQLPHLSAVAVVEVATGTCLAHHSRLRSFDPAAAAAYSAAMVKLQQQAMAAPHMRGERLEDILIPFRRQLHLIRLSKTAVWCVYLVVKAQDTSLAMAREILKSVAV